ncbi:MerR family transcriptional regulator [Fructilactobacillus frigidiflavus]|uniref:MerR family transcriptional regulator n=1 Tax=Fructilactobacillus frigidiflavus TaxID=3242688 RepID=UPI00375785B4
MKISEFVKKNNTTIDTVKHYINLKLLTPSKMNNWYFFTPKDSDDFKNIIQLKSLGMSLKLIKKIKDNHDENCGTVKQLNDNLMIIKSELDLLRREKEKLKVKEKLLLNVEDELYKKIAERKNSSNL